MINSSFAVDVSEILKATFTQKMFVPLIKNEQSKQGKEVVTPNTCSFFWKAENRYILLSFWLSQIH